MFCAVARARWSVHDRSTVGWTKKAHDDDDDDLVVVMVVDVIKVVITNFFFETFFCFLFDFINLFLMEYYIWPIRIFMSLKDKTTHFFTFYKTTKTIYNFITTHLRFTLYIKVVVSLSRRRRLLLLL